MSSYENMVLVDFSLVSKHSSVNDEGAQAIFDRLANFIYERVLKPTGPHVREKRDADRKNRRKGVKKVTSPTSQCARILFEDENDPTIVVQYVQFVDRWLKDREDTVLKSTLSHMRNSFISMRLGNRNVEATAFSIFEILTFFHRSKLLALLYLASFDNQHQSFATEELRKIFLGYLTSETGSSGDALEVSSEEEYASRLSPITPEKVAIGELVSCPYFEQDIRPYFIKKNVCATYEPRQALRLIYDQLIQECAQNKSLVNSLPTIAQWLFLSRSSSVSTEFVWRIIRSVNSALQKQRDLSEFDRTRLLITSMSKIWIYARSVEEKRKILQGFWLSEFRLISRFAEFINQKKLDSNSISDDGEKVKLLQEFFSGLPDCDQILFLCLTILTFRLDHDEQMSEGKIPSNSEDARKNKTKYCGFNIKTINSQMTVLENSSRILKVKLKKKKLVEINSSIRALLNFLRNVNAYLVDSGSDLFKVMQTNMKLKAVEALRNEHLWLRQIDIIRGRVRCK